MTANLLDIQNVTKVYNQSFSSRKQVVAVENVSLSLPADKAKITTLAGESGSGKSTLGLLVLGFIQATSGTILYKGKDISKQSSEENKYFRREIQAIFQNPFEAYNPFYKIDHVFDLLAKNFGISQDKEEKRSLVETALQMVRLDPSRTLGRYPHQLSGGQLQRVMLARAFLLKPGILVADEPVSMIDASLRSIVLDIMLDLRNQHNISQIYITHDLSTAYQISDEIMIMYQGNIVESGQVEEVIGNPLHPYTQLLIQSIPQPDPATKWKTPLQDQIKLDSGHENEIGCKFYPRCPKRMDICRKAFPNLVQVTEDHAAACYLFFEPSKMNKQDGSNE